MKRKAKPLNVKIVEANPATLNARVYEQGERIKELQGQVAELAKAVFQMSAATQNEIGKLQKTVTELKRQVSA